MKGNKKFWMKGIAVALLLLAGAAAAQAQSPSSFPYAFACNNDTATGTTQFKAVKINASGNCQVMAITDTTGYAGIAVSNTGTTGTVWVAFSGLVPVVSDNASTVQHYMILSQVTAGDGHDTGVVSYPSGGIVLGRVQTGAAGGSAAMVLLYPPEIQSGAGQFVVVNNAGATGTTVNTLTKLTAAPSTAVIAAITDTGGVVGITVSGAGTTGYAIIQTSGLASCVFPAGTTAGDYVQISAATAGNCADAGANYPSSGQAIGRVLSTNGGAGTYQIFLFAPETKGATITVASGTAVLGTALIASAACATVVTSAGTGILTTDVIAAGFNGDPTAVTGYIPLTTGMLTIIAYPTANNANFKVCNNTSAGITPGAITLNWRVTR